MMKNTKIPQDVVNSAPRLRRAFLAVAAVGALIAGCGAEQAPGSADSGGINAVKSATRAAPAANVSLDPVKTARGWSIGAPDAPVTIVEYASFTCGACANYFDTIEPRIKKEYVETGYVRFEFRSFVRNQPDLLATMVAHCLGEDKFAGVKNLYFSSQREWLTSANANDYVAQMARKAGMNSAKFRQCTSDAMVRTQAVESSRKAADEDGIDHTPMVFVNGEELERAFEWDAITQAVEDALSS